MKKLVYEDINLKTHFAYAIYKHGYSSNELKYVVYECDPDGNMRVIGEYKSYDKALSFVRNKCS